MIKNKLKSYLVIEILKSYFFVLISLSLLIWIVQAARFLNLVTEAGIEIEIYIKYIFFVYPKIISQLMIVSLLISLFLTIIKLQDNKELEIYWLSGISKIEISYFVLKISFAPTILALIFYVYLVPYTNYQSRMILANSEFSMVNSLVKKQNFNSPLKKLTIFVSDNDNKGNLKKIYIFEELKTIIAKKGRVLNIKDKNYLELIDGFIHEKDKNNSIAVVKFNKTLFDFTKYQTEIVKTPKLQDVSTAEIIKQKKNLINNKELKNRDYEINKRIFKPLFIPIISILCCFLFFANNEKINLNKFKIFLFSIGTIFIIFIEIILNLSVENLFFKYLLFFFPPIGIIISFYLLNNFLKKEPYIK